MTNLEYIIGNTNKLANLLVYDKPIISENILGETIIEYYSYVSPDNKEFSWKSEAIDHTIDWLKKEREDR